MNHFDENHVLHELKHLPAITTGIKRFYSSQFSACFSAHEIL